ncbi:lytic murein transglycosylase [Nitrincola tibetensis]|uniref:Lytic murein transglycosylase n=1 Tax=Nitrincola tibetensis TaxID=2219697 RepID=A0A364NMQ1_9GAMM|nr:lytic murein transglycosylase [Nitrincola tibetensis]RAU18351.1 lytic murein transglycosylase [Nitrincola tibetensis]
MSNLRRYLPGLLCAGWMSVSFAYADASFEDCKNELRRSAISNQISAQIFDQYVSGVKPDMTVIDRLNFQPEFRTPIWDYMAGLVDEERVEKGQQMREEHAHLLREIEQKYGIEGHIVLAIWGVETNYGAISGRYTVVDALTTLSCIGRRQTFFRNELNSALRILQGGHVNPDDFKGSWAGAFGHTQFIPSTFERIAVDFTGDGKRDIVGSIPDALASTANYLKRSNWQANQPWGFEVKLPANLNTNDEGRRSKRPLSTWVQRGLTRVDGSALTSQGLRADMQAGLIMPAGPEGPSFLVFRNFDALFSYNAAESYALAIGHLSDRILGAPGFSTPWPTDDPPISRSERRELQQLLLDRGHDIGAVDGLIGDRTRGAIQLEQRRLGLADDGRAGLKILTELRKGN